MSTAKRVIKNSGLLYARMGITMFISLYTTRLILNALGSSDFGIFNIIGGAIAMLGFLNAAMANATQRFMSYSEGEGDKEKQKLIFNISVVLHFFIALILGITLLFAGYFFFNNILNIDISRIRAAQVVYGTLIISTMFTVMTVPYDAVLNARENMLYYAIVGIIESILKLVVALIVVYIEGDKLVIYGVLMAIVPLLIMSIMRIYCHHKYEECIIAPRKYWDKGLMKQMGRFAGWNLLTSSSGIISQYGMGIVLNHFFGVIVNAAQGIANQVSGQLMTFAHVGLKSLNPVMVKNEGKGNREMVIRASFAGCRFSFLLFSLFSIPFIIETPYILKIWLNNVPEWAITFCRFQLIRILLEQLTLSINNSIYAQEEIKLYSKYKSVLNIMPIFLAAILFYFNYPPYFLYIVWIVCWSILGGIVALYFSCKNLNMSYDQYIKLVLIPCSLICITTFAVAYIPIQIMTEGLFRVSCVICLSIVFHILIGWFIGVLPDEKFVIKSLLYKLYYVIKVTKA